MASASFRLDSGLILIWIRLDFAWIRLDFAWIRLDFGLISAGVRFDLGWIRFDFGLIRALVALEDFLGAPRDLLGGLICLHDFVTFWSFYNSHTSCIF